MRRSLVSLLIGATLACGQSQASGPQDATPREDAGDLLAADPALAAELFEVARRVAAELNALVGPPRVTYEAGQFRRVGGVYCDACE